MPLRLVHNLRLHDPENDRSNSSEDERNETETEPLLVCTYEIAYGWRYRRNLYFPISNFYFLFSCIVSHVYVPHNDSLLHMLNSLIDSTNHKLHIKNLVIGQDIALIPVDLKEYFDYLCGKLFNVRNLVIKLISKNFIDYFNGYVPRWADSISLEGRKHDIIQLVFPKYDEWKYLGSYYEPVHPLVEDRQPLNPYNNYPLKSRQIDPESLFDFMKSTNFEDFYFDNETYVPDFVSKFYKACLSLSKIFQSLAFRSRTL